MERLGLKVRVMKGDGNCLFRALVDQMHHVDPQSPNTTTMVVDNHKQCRAQVCQYIQQHADELQPFLDERESLKKYVDRMSKDGVFGGNMELVAFCRLFAVDAMIYQDDGIIYRISSGSSSSNRVCLRLAYNHVVEHYDSVVAIRKDVVVSPIPSDKPLNDIEDWMIQVVTRSTGVTDAHARNALIHCQLKVDDAVENLLMDPAFCSDTSTTATTSTSENHQLYDTPTETKSAASKKAVRSSRSKRNGKRNQTKPLNNKDQKKSSGNDRRNDNDESSAITEQFQNILTI